MAKHNDFTLKEVLQQMIDKNDWKANLYQTKIQKFWSEVMGTSINEYTTELRLRRKKLFITITSAPLRQELSYSKDKLKKVVNEELGEEYVEDIVIR